MATFTPTGTLYLISNIHLDNTYQHTIDFTDYTEQFNYFYGKIFQTLTEYTYSRKDTTIKINMNLESLYGTNYIVYRNYTTSKWIYAFIVDKHYINENVTELIIETDVLQTYMFDYNWKDSFIEREHQNRWSGVNSPIYNIVDEGLTLGDEYIFQYDQNLGISELFYLIVSTVQLENPSSYSLPNTVQADTPTPFYYYIIDNAPSSCALLADNPSIISMSALPYATYPLVTLGSFTYTTSRGGAEVILYRINADQLTTTPLPTVHKLEGLTLPISFGTGFTRDNKYESKLLTYPYMYNLLTDNRSTPLMLKNEYLAGNDITINMVQNISHELKTKYYVSTGYKGDTTGKYESLINSSVNDLPLTTDVYKNYMQQNKASLMTNMALSGASTLGGLAVAGMTGGLALPLVFGSTMNAVQQIGGELAKQKDLKSIPDSVRHTGNNIAFDICDGNMSINFKRYTVHNNIKKLLADYFAMYGYKCLEVKIPNLRSRYYYNYIKTIGANLEGNFDNKDIAKIKDIYDKGITIWHNRSGVTPLSYQYDNVEMSLI